MTTRYVSVPVMSLYNLMVIYLFLPIPRKDVALAAGLAVSAICLIMYAALSGAKVGARDQGFLWSRF